VTGAVDGAVGTAAQAAGKITGEVTGEVAAEAGRAPFSLAGGVTAAASGSVSGATEFTQSGKDLKLEKGTEFVLSVQAVARGKQED
jgi:type IV secretory pathway TrbL component